MVPILIVAWLTRTRLPRWRQRLLDAGRLGKMAMGISAVLTGFLILTGADRGIEATLVRVSPAWLTAITTRVWSLQLIIRGSLPRVAAYGPHDLLPCREPVVHRRVQQCLLVDERKSATRCGSPPVVSRLHHRWWSDGLMR